MRRIARTSRARHHTAARARDARNSTRATLQCRCCPARYCCRCVLRAACCVLRAACCCCAAKLSLT
eukprot:7185728-Lingulodinium_polyedra.AAC.1